MIVFAVLTDPRSTREGGKIVVSSGVSHQLRSTVRIANRRRPAHGERSRVTNPARSAHGGGDAKRGWPFG